MEGGAEGVRRGSRWYSSSERKGMNGEMSRRAVSRHV